MKVTLVYMTGETNVLPIVSKKLTSLDPTQATLQDPQ